VPKTSHTFWGAILIVSHQYDKKIFRSNFDDFSGAGHNRHCQSWKSDPDDYVWHPKHTHTIMVQFLCFLLVRLKNNSFEFCRLFGPRYDRGGKSWKSDSYDSVLLPKHTHNIRDAVLIVLRSVRLKNVSVLFWRLLQARAPPLQAELKIGLGWLSFDSWNIPTLLGRISCRFWFVRVKTVPIKFLWLFWARVPPEQEMLETGPWWLV